MTPPNGPNGAKTIGGVLALIALLIASAYAMLEPMSQRMDHLTGEQARTEERHEKEIGRLDVEIQRLRDRAAAHDLKIERRDAEQWGHTEGIERLVFGEVQPRFAD